MKLLLLFICLPFVGFTQSDSTQMVVDTSLVYDISDVAPSFPGGATEMSIFLFKNFEYTDSARLYQENQKLFIEFVINIDGSISDAKIVRGQKYTGQELLRVMSIMPKWIPGEINCIKVKVRYTLPMNICLR
jgi:protein TonB